MRQKTFFTGAIHHRVLTISKNNYKVPLMDIDIDPNLRQFNKYNKDYDKYNIELENGEFKFKFKLP